MNSRKNPPPNGTPCEFCGEPMNPPHWDHCHTCGPDAFIGWVCSRCNTTMKRYHREMPDFLERWESYHAGHVCAPSLFPVGPSARQEQNENGVTKRKSFANGGGNGRYYRYSVHDHLRSCEQVAAILGVNANTARKHYVSVHPSAVQMNGVWLLPVSAVIDILRKKYAWMLTSEDAT